MRPPARLLLYTWLLLMTCFLSSCDLEKEDYISKYCPGSCTVIKGRVTREDGKPLVGATVRARWSKSGYLQPRFTREKAVTTTDTNGNYELRLLLRDQELQNGELELITEFEQDSYLSCHTYSSWQWYELRRDTTIIQNYAVAAPAYLQLMTGVRDSSQLQDQSTATIRYKLSSADTDSCTFVYSTAPGNYAANYVTVPAGKPVVVYTEQIKSGVRSTRKEIINLAPGEKRAYQLEF